MLSNFKYISLIIGWSSEIKITDMFIFTVKRKFLVLLNVNNRQKIFLKRKKVFEK